jgi:hypothetical protein
MRLRYRRLPDLLDPTNFSYYPYLQVGIRYEDKAVLMHALLDSGAIDTLFPASLAVELGIDLLSGVRKVYFGLGGNSAIGYLHDCHLQVQGLKQWTPLRIGFVDTIRVPLLGESGFFEHYQIIFERFNYHFELYPKMDALIRARRGRRRR